jgi:hypothetical protein
LLLRPAIPERVNTKGIAPNAAGGNIRRTEINEVSARQGLYWN